MSNVHWWNTHIGKEEASAIVDAIANKNIGMGSVTKAFESDVANLLNVPFVVATPSGSTALYISLMALGIGTGDEVIVPDRTFIATAHAVQLTGAKVVLVDVNNDNTNIDISKIEEKITTKTKVILPVHLNGRAVDIEAINLIARKNNIKVIEDACQSIFSKNKEGKYLGTLSELGCYSLGLAKLITVGFGGFIVCHNENMYKQIVKFRNHGRLDNEHINYDSLGFNFKVSDMIMSIGRVQLSKHIEKIDHCKKVYHLYKNAIKDLDFIDLIHVDTTKEVPLYVEVVSNRREELIEYLNSCNISINYLPPSLHLSKHLKQKIEDFNNSLYFNNSSFILPCGPNQAIENVIIVIEKLKAFKNEKKN
jgi:dTDP-4-amino-4,6-dideoxygalactose transaminase